MIIIECSFQRFFVVFKSFDSLSSLISEGLKSSSFVRFSEISNIYKSLLKMKNESLICVSAQFIYFINYMVKLISTFLFKTVPLQNEKR